MIEDTGKIDKFLPLIFRLDKDSLYDVKIVKHREKRSLNANNYCWKLCTEIGNVINKSKNQVYYEMLCDYGVFKTDENGELIVGIFPKNMDVVKVCDGYWQYAELINYKGLVAKKYYLIKGSSEYNKDEMRLFLNGIVQEAKNLGIKTKEDIEIERMIKDWENKYEENKKSTG